MERADKKDFKLMPKPLKMGLVCDLSLPQLEFHNFNVTLPEKEEDKGDSTDDYRKSRTRIAQNRRDKNALF